MLHIDYNFSSIKIHNFYSPLALFRAFSGRCIYRAMITIDLNHFFDAHCRKPLIKYEKCCSQSDEYNVVVAFSIKQLRQIQNGVKLTRVTLAVTFDTEKKKVWDIWNAWRYGMRCVDVSDNIEEEKTQYQNCWAFFSFVFVWKKSIC